MAHVASFLVALAVSSFLGTVTVEGARAASSSRRSAADTGGRASVARIAEALDAGRYDQAQEWLQGVRGRDSRVLLLRSRLALVRGEYEKAEKLALPLARGTGPTTWKAARLVARSLAARGKIHQAVRSLEKFQGQPEARRVRLLLGELLLRMGRKDAATPVLMTLIQDYNDDTIGERDGEGLALVGRAAALLHSRADANDAFDQAERAGNHSDELLRWRAELFLDAHDPGHAEEVLRDAAKVNPHHPDTLTLLARVKLAQALDFDAADKLVDEALAVNPHHTGALFVRAGVALRDDDHPACSRAIERGLAVDPIDLPLLSLRAAERFIADDEKPSRVGSRLNDQFCYHNSLFSFNIFIKIKLKSPRI